MRYITDINSELKRRILNFLYEDELFNVFLINIIENQVKDIGELYIEESSTHIVSVLHIKFDGNSYFTSFCAKSEIGYKVIAEQLKNLNYKKILLSGKMKDVSKILSYCGKSLTSIVDIYYKLDLNKYFNHKQQPHISFRKVTSSQEDINILSKFIIEFFEVTEEQDIADITDNLKLLKDVKQGVYFIEYKGKPVGMGRYSGETKNYTDITTIYIDPNYRGKGFGKKLMCYMIDNSISVNKIPVIQTSSSNFIARNIYESLGFTKEDDYSFEFIS